MDIHIAVPAFYAFHTMILLSEKSITQSSARVWFYLHDLDPSVLCPSLSLSLSLSIYLSCPMLFWRWREELKRQWRGERCRPSPRKVAAKPGPERYILCHILSHFHSPFMIFVSVVFLFLFTSKYWNILD